MVTCYLFRENVCLNRSDSVVKVGVWWHPCVCVRACVCACACACLFLFVYNESVFHCASKTTLTSYNYLETRSELLTSNQSQLGSFLTVCSRCVYYICANVLWHWHSNVSWLASLHGYALRWKQLPFVQMPTMTTFSWRATSWKHANTEGHQLKVGGQGQSG